MFDSIVSKVSASPNVFAQHYLEIQALSPADELASPQAPLYSSDLTSVMSMVTISVLAAIIAFFAWLLFSRIKEFNRLFAVLALILVIGGLPIAITLVGQRTQVDTRATTDTTPVNIIVTDVAANSFTIRWHTQDSAVSGIKISTDQDLSQIQPLYQTHQPQLSHKATVTELVPNTTYYVTIISNGIDYNHLGNPMRITTREGP